MGADEGGRSESQVGQEEGEEGSGTGKGKGQGREARDWWRQRASWRKASSRTDW